MRIDGDTVGKTVHCPHCGQIQSEKRKICYRCLRLLVE